jgi:hypothetical protein
VSRRRYCSRTVRRANQKMEALQVVMSSPSEYKFNLKSWSSMFWILKFLLYEELTVQSREGDSYQERS